ncbi:hypothetical protein Fmac_008511 [Flemingia macrophylla]|uniref:Uncharacterized protein n=1 Tax=Flemingia macrophylla TaxID=520843 RepID=A0ABD1MXK4_9FABA
MEKYGRISFSLISRFEMPEVSICTFSPSFSPSPPSFSPPPPPSTTSPSSLLSKTSSTTVATTGCRPPLVRGFQDLEVNHCGDPNVSRGGISSRRRTLRSRKPSRRNSPSTSAASRRFTARPKTKPKDSGDNSEDSEQAKLRVGFNSTIKREKPNVKWTDIMRLESTKQALQKAMILPVKFPQFFTGGLVWFSVRRLSPVEFG